MSTDEILLDSEIVKKRAVAGVVTYTLRGFFLYLFGLLGTFVLTILLDVSVFGVFTVVSALLNLFIYFSDIGLAAALIQKKENISKDDLSTTFTIQQGIIVTLVSIGLIFSGNIAKFYNLDSSGLFLLRILIFSLFLSSLKTIPSILLERNLKFWRLMIPQIVENLTFYIVAIFLAYRGYGISSFAWAVLLRGIVGLITVYILSPWVPRLGFEKTVAKKLTKFGLPFQLNSMLALIKDDLLTVFLGKLLPFSQIGYIGWSQKWAFLPLRFFMDNVNKVTFPAYSRLQHETQKLGKSVEKSLFFVTYFVYPSIFGLVAVAPQIIDLVPRYDKWEPALPLLYLFSINTVFSAISTTFTNALFALGRPKIVLYLMVFWTSSTWLLIYPFISAYGYLGVGLSSALISVTSLSTIYFVKKEIPVSVGKSIIGPLATSILMFFVIKSLQYYLNNSIVDIFITVFAGGLVYLSITFAIFRRQLIDDAMIIIKSIVSKNG